MMKLKLTAKPTQPDTQEQELCDRNARGLCDRAGNLRGEESEIDQINRALAHGNVAATRTLLKEVAAILSPCTVGEARRHRLFQ